MRLEHCIRRWLGLTAHRVRSIEETDDCLLAEIEALEGRLPQCGHCGRKVRRTKGRTKRRLWRDLKIRKLSLVLAYTPRRVVCSHCGVRALQMPVDHLVSNWAYMVMASLAWTLKAWFALSLPETGRWAAKYKSEKQSVLKMEFKTFRNAFIRVPCQILRTGRRIVYRLLAWNPWQHVFLRGVDALRRAAFSTTTTPGPLRC